MSLLDLNNIRGGYGRVDILKEVSIQVDQDEIVVIVGPNGAGKSTAMKAIFGMLNIRGGHTYFNGEEITHKAPDQIVKRGICYVPQVDNIFRDMTIRENLEMGAYTRHDDIESSIEHIYTLFPDLKAREKTAAGHLSGGQRQMVAMGRALMLQPKLLLLDEPTAGLSPRYMEQIFNIIRDVRDSGVAILLVEQHAKQALAFADRGYVLANGHNRHEGTGEALLADPDVAKMFLGG